MDYRDRLIHLNILPQIMEYEITNVIITFVKLIKSPYEHFVHLHNKIFIHANFHVSFSFGFHYNIVLLELITTSNTRSKRVNGNITTL